MSAPVVNTGSNTESDAKKTANETPKNQSEDPELGLSARKMRKATEEALLTGGSTGRQAVENAGFSDHLKNQLLDKIAGANFKNQHADASSIAGLTETQPGTLARCGDAAVWNGEEATPGAGRLTLEDAHEPLKPELQGKHQLRPIDTRIKRARVMTVTRKISSGLSEKERKEMEREFRERFEPEGRMPASISSMVSMANEWIGNNIARGQFKDVPDGPSLERGDRVDNPVVDTTEYLMNRITKRQDIVTPWIEKQQELAKDVNVFRTRMRSDWKRHAARMIASQGGSLQEQMQRAERHAAAERVHNPIGGSDEGASAGAEGISAIATVPRPFRDPEWERTEAKYMRLAVERLNSIIRSYSPDLAKKPYYSVERELARCFADVAPLLAGEIKERARIPAKTSLGISRARRSGNAVEGRLPGKEDAKVQLEGNEKTYGMKEFWCDLWKK